MIDLLMNDEASEKRAQVKMTKRGFGYPANCVDISHANDSNPCVPLRWSSLLSVCWVEVMILYQSLPHRPLTHSMLKNDELLQQAAVVFVLMWRQKTMWPEQDYLRYFMNDARQKRGDIFITILVPSLIALLAQHVVLFSIVFLAEKIHLNLLGKNL